MGTTIDAPCTWPLQHQEDNVLNTITKMFNIVPRLGGGSAAAGEECARRSEVHQH